MAYDADGSYTPPTQKASGMPSARITFRLTPALDALVDERVRQGSHVSDIMREALEQYFGLSQPQDVAVSDRSAQVADSSSDLLSDIAATVSDMTTTVSDMVAAVSDIQGRLAQLEARLEALAPTSARRQTARPTVAESPATAESPTGLPPHVQRIAEVAAQYSRLSLAELAQLLYDRGVYRAKERTGEGEKPVNRGTLTRWLAQARQAGLL